MVRYGVPAVETPDGLRSVFSTPTPYLAGSVLVFINGQLKRKDLDDGWEELGTPKVQLKEIPRADETVQLYYVEVT
jgi:hypothetical protein